MEGPCFDDLHHRWDPSLCTEPSPSLGGRARRLLSGPSLLLSIYGECGQPSLPEVTAS